MKTAFVLAVALASIMATAQTETESATADQVTEAAQAPAVAAPAKKVKAVKTARKAKKKKVTKPSAMAPAAMTATTEGAAQAPAATTGTTIETNPTVGTSTVTAAAPAADAKKWGVTTQVLSSNDYLTQGDIQTLTSIAGSYKVTDKLKLKVKQTFESLTAGPDLNSREADRQKIDDNNFRATFADFSVSSSLGGILGSNDLPVSLNYKYISGDAIYSTTGGYSSAHGMVEANLSIPYTLSPKWELSIDTQIRHVVNKTTENSHRILAIPTLSYAINDMVSIYQAAGPIYSFDRNERFRNTYQRAYLATGVSIVPVKGLTLDLNVSQDKAVSVTSDKPQSVTAFNLYSPTIADGGVDATFDAVAYEGSLTYAF
jgi:hypothetical protein